MGIGECHWSWSQCIEVWLWLSFKLTNVNWAGSSIARPSCTAAPQKRPSESKHSHGALQGHPVSGSSSTDPW